MKLSNLIICTCGALVLSSCGGQSMDSSAEDEGWAFENALEATEVYLEEDMKDQLQGGEPIPTMQRKLIKTANLSYEVQELDSAQLKIEAAVTKYGGYIASEERYFSHERENVAITARIPVGYFEAFMAESTVGVEEFESKSVSAQDVTEEFVDVAARIKTKKEVEQQYIALLDKANNVGEIMDIERELGYIREEIEAAEGRLKYLENSSSFSTVNMTAFKIVDVPSKYSSKFSNSFNAGWDGFVMLFVGLTALWPFLIIGTITFFIVRAYRRKKRKLQAK